MVDQQNDTAERHEVIPTRTEGKRLMNYFDALGFSDMASAVAKSQLVKHSQRSDRMTS
jgi:hypothetical protein